MLGEKLEKMHFETIFQRISQICPSLPPHFEDNWILLTFHQYLIYRAWISKNLAWLVMVHSKQSFV